MEIAEPEISVGELLGLEFDLLDHRADRRGVVGMANNEVNSVLMSVQLVCGQIAVLASSSAGSTTL